MIHAPRLETVDLWFSYEGQHAALRGTDLAVEPGEFLAIVGQNGSGKSTLAKHFNGLLRPAKGRVTLDGLDIAEQSTGRLARQVGYVFQNPDHQLFCPTVKEELSLGPQYLGLDPVEVQERVESGLQAFGLQRWADRGSGTLSFGLRRKVSVAAVFTMRPAVIILDEPTTGLEWGSAAELMSHFVALNSQGHSMVMITHDMQLVARYASRVAVMSEGRVVAQGEPQQIFRREEVLHAARIQPPQIVELARQLSAAGLELEGLTVEAICHDYLRMQGAALG